MLQQDKPDDFVIATGRQHSVRDFCEQTFSSLGITLEWSGDGVEEEGRVAKIEPTSILEDYKVHQPLQKVRNGDVLVSVDPRYFRPTEVETLLGDPTKAKQKLGWQPEISFDEMVKEMVTRDLEETAREAICQRNGFSAPGSMEADM
jgi:GDPmannose 4,6-dehydratase